MLTIKGYIIGEMLYQTKYFTLYSGIKADQQQKVILKVCRLEQPLLTDIAKLQHEYQTLKRLDLPGVIKVHDLINERGCLVLVLEDIQGQSLQQYLLENHLDLKSFFKISLQLVDVLISLHLQHIIHKDINPANIIINPATLQIKLADFSIASELTQETQDYVQLKNLEGSLSYFSPEQTGRMNRSVDYRTDFYSLGVTFYEMLSGRLPFTAEDALALVYCHIVKVPEKVDTINPKVPAMLAILVAKLLAKLPEERYSSAEGLKVDLLECQQQWEKYGHVNPFPLGQQDIQDHLIVSQKLYGRETQVAQLLEIFKQTSEGQSQLLLVSGYSGIGKTTLVKELYKPITHQRGYFVSGKYDQLQHVTPYSAIIDAMQELMRRLLAEPEIYLLQLKNDLIAALGNNGQIIIDVIPALALIVGPQPAVPELPSDQVQNRFMLTFQNLIRALAKVEHPLVIFLDDLQWIDSASLQLFNLLLTDKELQYFLLIGAYRDNEVAEDHPLIILLRQWKKNNILWKQVALNPLAKHDIVHLLADSLNASHQDVAPLAELIASKTHGNPFFINEFLKKLYWDKLLIFSYETHRWQWNTQQIQQQEITENVVDLLTSRIHLLPLETQQLLELAACIGHFFNLQVLSVISEQPLAKVAQSILSCAQAVLVEPVNEGYWLLKGITPEIDVNLIGAIEYRFVHDRIQQAAYQLVPEAERKELHLQIGRLLLKDKPLQENSEQLFDVLNHFNNSLDLVADIKEKEELVQYYYWAGKKAKAATAYEIAHNYLSKAVALTEQSIWQKKRALALSLYLILAECEYLMGNYQEADNYYNFLLEKAETVLETAQIYSGIIPQKVTLGEPDKAFELGKTALAMLKVKLNLKPSKLVLMHELFKVWRNSVKKIKTVGEIELKDPNKLAISHIYDVLSAPAYLSNQDLFAYIVCKSVNLSLNYGYSKHTPFFFTTIALVLISAFKAYSLANLFVIRAQEIAEQLGDQQAKARVNFMLGIFISHWYRKADKDFDYGEIAYQGCLDVGDLIYAGYSRLISSYTAFYIGQNLNELRATANVTLQALQRSNDYEHVEEMTAIQIIADWLMESKMEQALPIPPAQKLNKFKTLSTPRIVFAYYSILYYIMGDYPKALEAAIISHKYRQYTICSLTDADEHAFYALILAQCYINADKAHKKSYKKQFYSLVNIFAGWAKQCPENFEDRYLLLQAEQARLVKNTKRAIILYDQAIKIAQQNSSLYIYAIACERAADFYQSINVCSVAQSYLLLAYQSYQRWGAAAKCELLAKQHPDWLKEEKIKLMNVVDGSVEAPVSSIDIIALMKSTQIISSEIQLDKLLQKLLITLLQNAGAERGLLMVKEGEEWYVKAEGTIAAQRVILTQAEPVEGRTDLPLTLIHYVQRTQELLLVQSAKDFEAFVNKDPYLTEIKPQSVLILPVSSKRQLQHLLYLENKNTNHVFSAEHITALKVLASQAAISIENAHLYHQGTHDPLTGLANRNLLYQMFNQAVSKAKRDKSLIAILFFDLDGFKKINDTIGHEVGDKFLICFADQLKAFIREEDLAVRLGGDEFVVMLESIEMEGVASFIKRLMEYFEKPIPIQGYVIDIKFSVGISVYPNDALDITALLSQADTALYRAKANGKFNYQFYTAHIDEQLKQENRQEAELRLALNRNELCLYYQPIYSARKRQLIQLEALLRWRHPERGLLEAKSFIALAEKSGLISPIGEWAFNEACQQIKTWLSKGLNVVPIAVNVSGLRFKREMVSELFKNLLHNTRVDGRYLELEFTESVLIEHTQKLLVDMLALKELGIKLTLDDFGTCYSNLSYLQEFPVDKIKIDQSFTRKIEQDEKARQLVVAMIAMAHSLKLEVIAEGVETEQQLAFLEEKMVDAVQGYYLGRPMSADACIDLFEKLQPVAEK